MHLHSRFIQSILLLIFVIVPLIINAQNINRIKVYEDSIVSISKRILSERNEEVRLKTNEQLWKYVDKATRQEGSINYSFDTLNFVSVLTSDDKKFRIFTWTIRMNDGRFQYYGITQSYVKNTKSYRYNKLNDYTARLGRPNSKNLSPKKWYGAYYYKLVQTKSGKKTYYTLLGWKGYDKVISMKVIEIATLKLNGDVVFGYPIFNIRNYEYFKNSRVRRLVFKYSARVKMYLDYDIQSIHIEKKKKKKHYSKNQRGFTAQNKEVKETVKVKTITKPMIVMDRLEPTNEELEGVYEFYYPETNVVDALLFENNKWNYYPDVDARNNSADEKGAKPKKAINYDLY